MQAKTLIKILWIIVALHLAGGIFAPLPHEARLTLVRLSAPFLWLGMAIGFYYRRRAWRQLEALWEEINFLKCEPFRPEFKHSHQLRIVGAESLAKAAQLAFFLDDWEVCQDCARQGVAAIATYRDTQTQ